MPRKKIEPKRIEAGPLSRERILACALDVTDREGVDRASLRQVAADLGVHVTSLYNHVPTKDALFDGVVEELFASGHFPVGDLAWDDWVRGFFDELADVARKHPRAFALLLRRPAQGPVVATTFEAGMRAFVAAGLDTDAAYDAVKAVSLAALGCCAEEAQFAKGEAERTDMTALNADAFPLLLEVAARDGDLDVVATMREVLVGGLAHRIASAQ